MPAPEKPNHVEILRKLQAEARGGKGKRRGVQTQLAHQKVGFGYAVSGLRDILLAFELLGEAEAGQKQASLRASDFDKALKKLILDPKVVLSRSEDPKELARCGEALRVYARDVQLSRTHADDLPATIRASVACFTWALERLDGAAAKEQKAWCLAHRAACVMMEYWLGLVSGGNAAELGALFQDCSDGFEDARKEMGGQYPWATQFSAFLYALRGAPGDFDQAVAKLESLGDALSQPTIQRSIAMLMSYNAADPALPVDQRRKAAAGSINAAMNAQKVDQDEFLGPYSGAVSRWALFEMKRAESAQELEELAQDARMACETAEIRARNAISQALVALVGLTFVRGQLALAQRDEEEFKDAVQESRNLQKVIRDAEFRDIESRAMVYRDPVWRALKSNKQCLDAFSAPGYDDLLRFPGDKAPTDGKKRFVRAI